MRRVVRSLNATEPSFKWAQVAAVVVAATNAETCSQGYVITGDAGFLAPFARSLEVQGEAMAALQRLYDHDHERVSLLRDLRDALGSQREYMLGAAVSMLLMEEQSGLARDRAVLASAGTRQLMVSAGLGVLLLVLVIATLVRLRRSAQDVYSAGLLPDFDSRYEP